MAVLSETFDQTGGPSGKVVHRSNALISDSKTPNDPAEFRAGTPPGVSEALRKDAGDRLSADGANRTERVLLVWKEDLQGRGYLELYGQTAHRDGDMNEDQLLARFSHTNPFVRGLSAGGAAPSGSNEFRHPDGIVWLVVQDDGNLVIYQNREQWNYGTGRPIWSSGSQMDPAQTVLKPRPTPPPAPPSEPHEPSQPEGVRVVYKGFDEVVRPGDFARLEQIFGIKAGQSDIDAYHAGRSTWEAEVQRFFNRVSDDNVST